MSFSASYSMSLPSPNETASRRSQPPLALSVPLSRFTPRVGGGSAFYVSRLHTLTVKTIFLLFGCFTLTLFWAGAATPPLSDFVGTYEGASPGRSSTGRSFVLQLDVTKQNGAYSLSAEMNDTNREEGMDHTSNTHWRWTGTGSVRNDVLVFTFTSTGDQSRQGSIRRDHSEFILTLDRIRYRLQFSKHN
jgi:hypothetical protein